tara:strand:- start:20 stop:841 length:822 start_codon:yes stop_codon:yes gene_type:complete
MQIELEQGSLGWHEHRAKYRNASESGAVMGVSPYQTPRELWESKNGIGKKFVGNVATDYGIAMEPKALARLEEILDVKLEPTVFVDGEYSASLDGFNHDVMVEIKCPYQKQQSKLWQTSSAGDIPEHYYWQMVHQQMVSKAKQCYFFVYIDDKTYSIVSMLPNQGDIEKLRAAWDDFYANPPEPKFQNRDDLIPLAEEYTALKVAADEANKKLKEIETKLKQSCEVSSVAGNVQIQTISKKGTIDYKSIPDIAEADLESYRKPTTTYQKVTIK